MISKKKFASKKKAPRAKPAKTRASKSRAAAKKTVKTARNRPAAKVPRTGKAVAAKKPSRKAAAKATIAPLRHKALRGVGLELFGACATSTTPTIFLLRGNGVYQYVPGKTPLPWLAIDPPPKLLPIYGFGAAQNVVTGINDLFASVFSSDDELWVMSVGYSTGIVWSNSGHPQKAEISAGLGTVVGVDGLSTSLILGSDGNVWWNDVDPDQPVNNQSWTNIGQPSGGFMAFSTAAMVGAGGGPLLWGIGKNGLVQASYDGRIWNWNSFPLPAGAATIASTTGGLYLPSSLNPDGVWFGICCTDATGEASNLFVNYRDNGTWRWLSLGRPPQTKNVTGVGIAGGVANWLSTPFFYVIADDGNLWRVTTTGQWTNCQQPASRSLATGGGAVRILDPSPDRVCNHVFVVDVKQGVWDFQYTLAGQKFVPLPIPPLPPARAR